MKKAKIMLTAIAVIAVIGGAVAFKAKTTQRKFFYTVNGICTATTSLFSNTTSDPSVPIVHYSLIANPSGDCTARLTTDL